MGFGPPGFLHAPASKNVMACVGLASLLVRASFLSPSRVSLTPRAVLGVGAHGRQLVSRLVLSNLAFTSMGELLVGVALLYRLTRDAERRRGTDRYAAFLVFVVFFATFVQILATCIIAGKGFGSKTNIALFTPGPYALVWAHLPYYVLDVPARANEPRIKAFGVRWCAASKMPTYALFAQFLFASSFFANDGHYGAVSPALGAFWSRVSTGLFGLLAACLLRTSWFPANVERRRNGKAFSRSRWWPALVRAACSVTFKWIGFDPGAARTGAPRVFVAAARPQAGRGAPVRNAGARGGGFGFDRDGGGLRTPAAPPPESSVEALTAMGFDEGSVRRALADSGNNLALATESLLEDGAR